MLSIMFDSPPHKYIAAPIYFQFAGAALGLPGPPGDIPGSLSFASFATQPQSLVIRTEFPETWLLDVLNITDNRFVVRLCEFGICPTFFLHVSLCL